MQVGDTCCLDEEQNGICDNDEVTNECPPCELDCSKCSIPVQEKIVEVKKYVCEDGREVDKLRECAEVDIPPLSYIPDQDNQLDSHIREVSITPACRASSPGGEIYYKVDTVPRDIEVQLKELPDGNWEDIYSINAYTEGRASFIICDSGCPFRQADFHISPDKAYVMRLKIDQTLVWNTIEYSNEHIVDTRAGQEFVAKKC